MIISRNKKKCNSKSSILNIKIRVKSTNWKTCYLASSSEDLPFTEVKKYMFAYEWYYTKVQCAEMI